jgi:hypothetical protein
MTRLRERRNVEAGEAQDKGTSTSGSKAALSTMREAGERFLAAGDDAISRALSGDSETYLAATRQEGGQ